MKYIIASEIDLGEGSFCLVLLDETNRPKLLNEAILKARLRLKRDPMAKIIMINGDISWFSFSIQDNESMKVINKLHWTTLQSASIEIF